MDYAWGRISTVLIADNPLALSERSLVTTAERGDDIGQG